MTAAQMHIPSADEVRLAYIDRRDFVDQVRSIERRTDDEYGAEFDQWLGDRDRKQQEDLLKSLREEVKSWYVYQTRDIGDAFPSDSVVSLIEERLESLRNE